VLALKELLGSKVKFGLIAAAIGLVVSLTLLMSAMSEGLITGMTGAKGSLEGDALVFQRDTQSAMERSLLNSEDLRTIAETPGAAKSYGVGHAMISAEAGAETFDARVFGLEAAFDQLPLVEGRYPAAYGEAIVDETARSDGIEVGDTVQLSPAGGDLTVVGFTRNRRYVMAPVFFVDMQTWSDVYAASVMGSAPDESTAGATVNPQGDGRSDRLDGAASIAAVSLEPGVTIKEFQALLGDDYEVVTPKAAARSGNGMPVMILAVNGIQVVSLLIGAMVIGIFFYITTLHKTTQIAAIKALGASGGYLYGQLVLQIAVLVTVAAAVGIALALGAGASMPPAMAFDPQAGRWTLSLVAVYIMALLGSLFSLRSILKVDPATALDRGEH
jgi:putative ABC transport system permease protein